MRGRIKGEKEWELWALWWEILEEIPTCFVDLILKSSSCVFMLSHLIPDICHFFYTGMIFDPNILHPETMKNTKK